MCQRNRRDSSSRGLQGRPNRADLGLKSETQKAGSKITAKLLPFTPGFYYSSYSVLHRLSANNWHKCLLQVPEEDTRKVAWKQRQGISIHRGINPFLLASHTQIHISTVFCKHHSIALHFTPLNKAFLPFMPLTKQPADEIIFQGQFPGIIPFN